MTLTPFVAGNVLAAADLNRLLPLSVFKSATETVNNSTTLQNDDELALSFTTTGITYLVELRAIVGPGGTTSDIKFAWARTGTLTQMTTRSILGPQAATTDVSATSLRAQGGFALGTSVQYGCDGASNGYVEEKFMIRVDVAGTLTLQWAQQAAVAVNTTVVSGSTLIAYPVA